MPVDSFAECLTSIGTALDHVVDTPACGVSEQAVQERLSQARCRSTMKCDIKKRYEER